MTTSLHRTKRLRLHLTDTGHEGGQPFYCDEETALALGVKIGTLAKLIASMVEKGEARRGAISAKHHDNGRRYTAYYLTGHVEDDYLPHEDRISGRGQVIRDWSYRPRWRSLSHWFWHDPEIGRSALDGNPRNWEAPVYAIGVPDPE